MRYSFLLASLMFLSVQSATAVMITGEGLDTGHGFIKWEQLMSLPQQMNALHTQVRILQACAVLAAGTLIYMKWFYKPQNQEIDEEKKLLVEGSK